MQWFLYLIAVNIFMAWENNWVRVRRIKAGNPKQIEHPIYGAAYCIICGLIYFKSDLWLVASVLFLHLSVFPVCYNKFSNAPSLFYLSKTTTAWTDRTMVRIGIKDTEDVNISALIISIVFLWLHLHR
jgi:hypothetical protein